MQTASEGLVPGWFEFFATVNARSGITYSMPMPRNELELKYPNLARILYAVDEEHLETDPAPTPPDSHHLSATGKKTKATLEPMYFTTALTTSTGGLLYLFCRSLQQNTWNSTSSSSTCCCIASVWPFFTSFQNLLDSIIVDLQLEGNSNDFRFLSSPILLETLAPLQTVCPPKFSQHGQFISLSPFNTDGMGGSMTTLERGGSSSSVLTQWTIPPHAFPMSTAPGIYLLWHIRNSAEILAQMYAALLHESSIIVVGSERFSRMSCVLVLQALVYPFLWCGITCPSLSNGMEEIALAPVPYIIGCSPAQFQRITTLVRRIEMPSTCDTTFVLNLDHGSFERMLQDAGKSLPRGLHNLPHESSLVKSLQKVLNKYEKIFPSQSLDGASLLERAALCHNLAPTSCSALELWTAILGVVSNHLFHLLRGAWRCMSHGTWSEEVLTSTLTKAEKSFVKSVISNTQMYSLWAETLMKCVWKGPSETCLVYQSSWLEAFMLFLVERYGSMPLVSGDASTGSTSKAEPFLSSPQSSHQCNEDEHSAQIIPPSITTRAREARHLLNSTLSHLLPVPVVEIQKISTRRIKTVLGGAGSALAASSVSMMKSTEWITKAAGKSRHAKMMKQTKKSKKKKRDRKLPKSELEARCHVSKCALQDFPKLHDLWNPYRNPLSDTTEENAGACMSATRESRSNSENVSSSCDSSDSSSDISSDSSTKASSHESDSERFDQEQKVVKRAVAQHNVSAHHALPNEITPSGAVMSNILHNSFQDAPICGTLPSKSIETSKRAVVQKKNIFERAARHLRALPPPPRIKGQKHAYEILETLFRLPDSKQKSLQLDSNA